MQTWATNETKMQVKIRAEASNPRFVQAPVRGRSTVRGRSAVRPALRQPTIKRAVIQGAIVALLYFVVIQWVWKSAGTSTATNVLFSLGGFVIYSGVVYGVDRWKYQRALRKGSSR